MKVIGIIWTLYPLLGLLAFLEFTVGLAHVFLCLPYAHFYLAFWCGISAAITSVYALLLDFPNKCELLLQFVSTMFAFFLSLTSTAEAICLRRVKMAGGQISFCAGLLNRTATKQQQCERVLGHFQSYLLERISDSPHTESLHSAQMFIASIIAICALAQLVAGIVLFTYSARANHFRLTSAHWHLLLGLALLLLSLAHGQYCCQLFFVHLLAIVGIYSLLFAFFPLPPTGHPLRQMLAIVGSALGTALVALATFSIICWANLKPSNELRGPPLLLDRPPNPATRRESPELGVLRFCHYPEWAYAYCERQLDFSFPYLDWPVEQVVHEKLVIRMAVHSLLAIASVGLCCLFMADAFC